jgi:hypothetical protein
MKTFRLELTELINKYSLENGSNTPDFILGEYLLRCIENFDITLQQREQWFGRPNENRYFRADEIIAESHEHVFDSDGGSCRCCGKTVIDLLDSTKIIIREPLLIREDRSEPEERTKDELS